MKKVFYFGLEPLKARYTYQLSKEWMPATFEPYSDKVEVWEDWENGAIVER